MANLTVEMHDDLYHIRSQDFYLQFPDAEKNTRILWLLLRTFHEPENGKLLFTYE